MIDIHCLTYPGHNADWYAQLKAQLLAEPEVILHEVHNTDTIPNGRAYAYTLGEQPYVGYVDCDDLIKPGIFNTIQAAFDVGCEVVSCNEMLIDADGREIQPGVHLAPHLYSESIRALFLPNVNHHIFCFKRELLNPDYAAQSQHYIDQFPQSFGDCPYFAVKDITHRKAVLLPLIGYYYRRHKDQHTAWLNSLA